MASTKDIPLVQLMKELNISKLPFVLTDEILITYKEPLENYQLHPLTDALYDVILEAFPTGDIERIQGSVLLARDKLTFLGKVTTTARVRKNLN